MNSNSYLGMSIHPKVMKAEEEATREFGVGPGAVRFISGTYKHHIEHPAGINGCCCRTVFAAAQVSGLVL